MSDHSTIKIGTVGGTLISILATITIGDMLKTIVLAAVGATVSFCISLFLKRMIKPPRNR